ncbi:MAG: FadR/GntR family transcriptional regulator, partial [Nakamurella sp.]
MAVSSKRHLSSLVMDDLGLKIVSGAWSPGYIIDVDALESELGVSRTVVREAIKVLTSKGLIAARPKFGTYVRDRLEWNLLDADVMSWRD